VPLDGDHFWTRRSPRSTRSRPEESRAAHEGGGRAHPPRARPLPRGQPGDPPDVKSMQNSSIYTQTSRKKPRSEVPPPQASVATRSQSRPSPAGCRRGIIIGGHGRVSRRGHHHHEGQGPEGGGHGEGSTRGRTSPPLFRWRRSAMERGIIATVIVFINITIIITILISFTRSTLPHPAVIPT